MPGLRRLAVLAAVLTALVGCAAQAQRPMQLRRVILYQNGIGYFERQGHLTGPKLSLSFATPELDDVLKTLTVIDRLGGSVATVDVPTVSDKARTMTIDVRLGAVRNHDLLVGYAVPTPTWKAAYRVVLDDEPKSTLLQGWAMVNNASQENWESVALTLATGAPMSFAGDLSKPEYVSRPDARGKLVAPTVLGPIDGETSGAMDNDADGILDSVDKCPNDPELVNDYDDEDGCPDRSVSRTMVTDTAVVILHKIQFTRGNDAIEPSSQHLVDSIAAAMKGNADIARVEISGHASIDEVEPWSLASRRSAIVQTALIARGVEPHRLLIAPYGSTQLLDKRDVEAAHAKNRRVEFVILSRDEREETNGTRPVANTQTMQASVRSRTKAATVAGAVRYVLSEPVSIKKGASSMVAILNKPITGEDVYLFKPDANGPGSDRHPFRAVRLVNTSGFTLEPGPIAIFARGSFVGDTLLGRLAVDETAWIPYALDGSTTVTSSTANAERPSKLIAIQKGIITVENTATSITRYTIASGRDTARTIFVRHPKTYGYVARDLPPNTLDQGDAYLVPLPLSPAKQSVLAIEERQPVRRQITLAGTGRLELGAYVEGVPAALGKKLDGVIALRRELATGEEELVALRVRVGDLATRANEIRQSIKSIERVKADDLRKRLVASLAETTAESEGLAKTLGLRTEAMWALRTKLADAIRDLSLDERLPT